MLTSFSLRNDDVLKSLVERDSEGSKTFLSRHIFVFVMHYVYVTYRVYRLYDTT